MKNYYEYKSLQNYANAVARNEGYGKATKIICEGTETTIKEHTDCGYRKNTTDEYVPNAYMNNFGWKNCYYQAAQTTVAVPYKICKYFGA